MALDGTYAGLQASVADWLNRADLTSQIADFITLAHFDLNQRLRLRPMMSRVEIALDSELVNLPEDWSAPISLRIEGQGVLDCIDPDAMAQLKFDAADITARPTAYCVVGDQLELGPAPGQSYTGLIYYYAAIPALSNAAPSNWLLSLSPAAYLYGALLQSAPFLKDDTRLATWGQLYVDTLQALQGADQRHGARLSPRAAMVV